MGITTLLLFLGGIILLGVLGNFLFSRTKVPTPVILMALGILLGPVTGWVRSDAFGPAAPYFGTIALILILFEGGLDLEIEQAMKQSIKSASIGIIYFSICAATIYFILFKLHILPQQASILAALVLAGTSPTVLFPVVSMLNIPKELKTLIMIETALTEVLTVITVVIYLDVAKTSGAVTVGNVVGSLLLATILSMATAAAAGAVWVRLMRSIAKEPLSYMLTLGTIFILYAIARSIGAEPALTVFFFGLILGNSHWILKKIAPKHAASAIGIHETVKAVNAELSFLVRTFFFVFMGLLFDFSHLSTGIITGAGLTVIALLIARWLVIRVTSVAVTELRPTESAGISVGMISRGLACAVMAFTAAESGIPAAGKCVPLAFLVILATNLIMTAFIFTYERREIPVATV